MDIHKKHFITAGEIELPEDAAKQAHNLLQQSADPGTIASVMKAEGYSVVEENHANATVTIQSVLTCRRVTMSLKDYEQYF